MNPVGRAGLAVALVSLGALTGCAGTASGPAAKPVTQVVAGECFDLDAEGATAFVYPDCSPPHLYESYFVHALEGETFPGDPAIAKTADEVCTAQFATFLGTPSVQSQRYASAYLGPTEASWMTEHDRSIVCVVVPLDGTPRGGSAARG